jgi:hypothetical protein
MNNNESIIQQYLDQNQDQNLDQDSLKKTYRFQFSHNFTEKLHNFSKKTCQ